jgi:hypothetical protein
MHKTAFISASLAAGLLAGGMTLANASAVDGGDNGGLEPGTGIATIGGETFTYVLTKSGESQTLGFNGTFTATNGASLTLNISSDADPVITTFAAGTDPVGGTSFANAVAIPLAAPFNAPGATLSSKCTISGSLTDGGDGTVGASSGPVVTPGFFQDCTLDGVVASSVGPTPFGPVAVGVGGTTTYGGFTTPDTPFLCPAAGCTFMDILISFTNQAGAAGAGDSIAFTGSHVITLQTPEPSVLALFGLGLSALGLVRRRKVV